jgi:hypothetical protein
MILSGRKENLHVTIIVDGSWCARTQPSGYVISRFHACQVWSILNSILEQCKLKIICHRCCRGIFHKLAHLLIPVVKICSVCTLPRAISDLGSGEVGSERLR